jgi:hypothetical protein
MDTAYLSALAALTGSTVGGLTSLATSWLSHHVQFRTRLRHHDLSKREELYRSFIEEASRTYGHALEHNEAEVSNLVALHALVNRMRFISSPKTVDAADRVLRVIIDTYLGPNRTLREIREAMGDQAMDPLRRFSDVCRDELRRLLARGSDE